LREIEYERNDFFLVSTEDFFEDEPRRCTSMRRVRYKARNDLMLVSITPPISGNRLERNTPDVDVIVLASRHQGHTLFPIRDWPCYVHCARLLAGGIPENGIFAKNSSEVFDWGALFASEEDARRGQLPPFSLDLVRESEAKALEKARTLFSPEQFEELKANSQQFIRSHFGIEDEPKE
jgi:hypothetical protein